MTSEMTSKRRVQIIKEGKETKSRRSFSSCWFTDEIITLLNQGVEIKGIVALIVAVLMFKVLLKCEDLASDPVWLDVGLARTAEARRSSSGRKPWQHHCQLITSSADVANIWNHLS